jgi:hypothetical protein
MAEAAYAFVIPLISTLDELAFSGGQLLVQHDNLLILPLHLCLEGFVLCKDSSGAR